MMYLSIIKVVYDHVDVNFDYTFTEDGVLDVTFSVKVDLSEMTKYLNSSDSEPGHA